MRKSLYVMTGKKLPQWIIDDIKDYHFQDKPWNCWITCIKNLSITMKRHYHNCPSPTIRRFNRTVGAKDAIIPEFQTVCHLINKKIFKKVPVKIWEKADSNLKELKSLVERKDTSPVIFSVNTTRYMEVMKRKFKQKEIGYEIEGIEKDEDYDHVLIAFMVDDDVIFFDPYTPYLELPGKNTPEKAIFKLSTTIIDQLWHEAVTAPRWIMWLEYENPYQQRLNIK